MQQFKQQFTRIKDVSDRRRLPRLGKIRLGKKAISKKTGKEYPTETPYFVVPDEVAAIYGDEPTEIDVMLPVNDPEVVFPQNYCWYGQSRGAKCIGNGERAMRANDDGTFEEVDCPCSLLDEKKCQRRAHLMVLIPKVNLGGIYQIDLGSYHSIVDINSGLDYVEAMVGRFAMVPLKLKRIPRDTHADGKKQVHYTLHIHMDVNIEMLNSMRENTQRILTGLNYALPAPENINPQLDDEAPIDYVDEENGDVIEIEPVEEEPQSEIDKETQRRRRAGLKIFAKKDSDTYFKILGQHGANQGEEAIIWNEEQYSSLVNDLEGAIN